MRAPSPRQGLSVIPRTGLALWVTAVLGTNALCWARFARARLDPDARAALSWMGRPSKRPWEERLGARGRVLLRHAGRPSGSLVMDDTDTPRSQAAQALAHRYQRREK